MELEIEFEALGELLKEDDKSKLLRGLEKEAARQGVVVKEYGSGSVIGTMGSFDPAFWSILVSVANVSAVGIALKGLFDNILEWQKGRSQKIMVKVGDVSVEVPANASRDDVIKLSSEIGKIAQKLQKN